MKTKKQKRKNKKQNKKRKVERINVDDWCPSNVVLSTFFFFSYEKCQSYIVIVLMIGNYKN